MGWSNYIVIPDLKLKVEISRNFDEDEDLSEKIEKLQETISILRDSESMSSELKRLSLDDATNVLNCARDASIIDFEYFDVAGLLLFLNAYKIEFDIYMEGREELNGLDDYKEIKINYGGE